MQGDITTGWSDAEVYDRLMGRQSRLLVPLFIRFIGSIHDGDHVLDVGCGTGSLTFTIANSAQPSKIVGMDSSVPFIEYVRLANADPRVTFEVGDAQQLPFPDASFDKSLSLLAIHLVPDPPGAVAEMCRVTRPGGMVAVCSWDSPGGLVITTIFRKAATALDPSAEIQRHGTFRRKEGTLRDLLVELGLREVEETALTFQMNFDLFDELWSHWLKGGGPIQSYLVKLSPEHKQALRDRLHQEVLKGRPDGPFTIPARALAARGKVADN